jgi:hypothetical protein
MLEINTDELIAEAVNHMEDETDVRWSIGMALQVLYGDKWLEVQERLNQLYLERVKANTYS